jgi:protein required for attachment to host cells
VPADGRKAQDRERLGDSSPIATIAEKDAAIRDADLGRAARQAALSASACPAPPPTGKIAEESVRASEAELLNRLHFLGISTRCRRPGS